jgi:hypothetical protein
MFTGSGEMYIFLEIASKSSAQPHISSPHVLATNGPSNVLFLPAIQRMYSLSLEVSGYELEQGLRLMNLIDH